MWNITVSVETLFLLPFLGWVNFSNFSEFFFRNIGAQNFLEFSRIATNILALCHCEKSLISNEGLLVYCIFEKSLVVWWRISNFVRWQNVCCDWRIMNGFGNFRVVRGKSGEHWSRYTNSLCNKHLYMSPYYAASFFIFPCEHEMYAFYSECMTMQLHVE